MNKEANVCNKEAWRSVWAREFNLSKEVEYHLSTRQPLYELFDRSIAALPNNNGFRVLEIGCGTAIDSCLFGKKYKNSQIFCLDIFYPAVKLAERIAEDLDVSLNLLNCDAARTCFKDNSFDLIFSQGVLEHFRDITPAMKEQVRLLKDNGILIIDVPQTYTLYSVFKHRMMKKGTWLIDWETQFSYRDLVKLGMRYSLEAIDVCGHEYDSNVRFFNFVLFRNIIKRFQRVNPWRESLLFKKLDLTYDSIWNALEKKRGHYFLVNIAVAFKKKK